MASLEGINTQSQNSSEAIAAMRIFLSYSRHDKGTADNLVSRLEAVGHSVWMDRKDITAGDQWRRQIVEAVEAADILIVALSPNSVQSRNVRKELDLAEEANARIIPVIIEPVDIPPEMKYHVAGLQRVNLTDNFDTEFGRLLAALGPPEEPAVSTDSPAQSIAAPEELTDEPPISRAETPVATVDKLHESLEGVEGEQEENAPLDLDPEIVVKLSSKSKEAVIGEEVKWTVTVRNDGKELLREVTVMHDGQLLGDPFELEPGRWRRFTFVATYGAEKGPTETVEAVATTPGGATAESAVAKRIKVYSKDGKEIFWVPAGKFLYGDDREEVYLAAYWIDKTSVTNGEYARFVEETGHAPPMYWQGKSPSNLRIREFPVVNVSWDDAKAYARWAGKDLPSEKEWEKAARGEDGRTYPWGNQKPTAKLCKFGNNVGSGTRVGSYSPQGDSPYGCVDMSGNVWEWTESVHGANNRGRILCGGAKNQDENGVRAAVRASETPSHSSDSVGFRTAITGVG